MANDSLVHDLGQLHKSTGTDKQDLAGIDRSMIVALAASANTPVQKGEQSLLNAFTADIAPDIVRPANLVDLVNEDNAAFGGPGITASGI